MLAATAATAATAAPAAQGAGRYTVGIDERLTRLAVEACFDELPVALEARGSTARRALRKARRGDGTGLRLEAGRLPLAGGHKGCVAYEVDLHIAGQSARVRASRDVVVVETDTWLWLPAEQRGSASLKFDLPDGIAVSVPWPPVPGEAETYRLTETPRSWPARTAFGRFASAEIEVPGARLRVAAAFPDSAAHLDKINAWIQANARAIATLYGEFPIASPQVLVTVGERRGSGPVPWGQVLRGGQPAVMLTVDPRHDLDAFLQDWTLSHEFSHLLLPYISRRQAWLSEGFASYYQNVLRARAGLLTEQAAWQKLHNGFGRGIADVRGRPLSEATRRMHSEGAYMRVYWSGVAVALLGDVGIRRATAQRASLDTALAQLRSCCVPGTRTWTGRELAAHIDRFTATDVFGELVARYEHAPEFPPVQELYPSLGIEVRDGIVHLNDDAPLAGLRRAIMTASVAPE